VAEEVLDSLESLTLVLTYYRQPKMLARHLEEWNKYEGTLRIVLVDDGSPEPALPIVKKLASKATLDVLEIYRTDVDLPWCREFARNLGAKMATTPWLLIADLDHLLPLDSLLRLRETALQPKTWFRFRRMRVGKADETRKKDQIPLHCEFGEIHPHVDSYLTRAKHYWKVGGYNEAFCGVLGGGNEFLRRFQAMYQSALVPGKVFLHVYTRSVINDASDLHCSRDTQPGKDLWRAMQKAGGGGPPTEWLTLPWSRVL
jgi:hypothetical protein